MTIAIQYQYRNLVLEEDFIKFLLLVFNGKFERLTIPFAAIFSDPSMNFVFKIFSWL